MAKAEMKASLMLAEGQWERSRCRSETAYILAALWRRPTFVRLTFCRRSTCMQNGAQSCQFCQNVPAVGAMPMA